MPKRDFEPQPSRVRPDRTSCRFVRQVLWVSVIAVGLLVVGPERVHAQENTDEGGTAAEKKSSQTRDRSPAEKKALERLKEAREHYHSGEWFAARKAYRSAYESAPSDTPVRVEAALGRSTLLWEQGDYDAAESYIEEALDLAREQELHGAVGRLLLTLGHTEASQGRLESAEQTLRHCVRLAAEQNDAVFGPLCKLNHRLVRKLQGESVGSEASYRRALQKLESTGSPLTVGLSLAKTAELYAKGGRQGRAFDLLDRADSQYEKAGSVPAQARNRMMRARLLQSGGEWAKARQALKGLEESFSEMGSKPALVDVYGLLGSDAQHRGAYEEARTHLKRALETAEATGSPQLVAKARVALCNLGATIGSYERAKGDCRAAIERFERVGMPQLEAKARAALGRAAQAAGKLEVARQSLLGAVKLNEEEVHPQIREHSARVNNFANLCQIEMRMGLEGALYRCRKALTIMEGAPVSDGMLAATHYALGHAAANEGHAEEATKHLEESATIYAELSSPDLASYAESMLKLGAVYKKTESRERALEVFRKAVEKLEASGGGHVAMRVKLRSQYAQLLLGEEKWKEAADQLERVVEEARRSGAVGEEAWAWSALARAESRLGNEEETRRSLEKALPLAKKAGDRELVETVRSNLESLEQ